jgi:hypothetical protein
VAHQLRCKAEGWAGLIARSQSQARSPIRYEGPAKQRIYPAMCVQTPASVQASPHQLLLSLVDPAPLAKQAYERFRSKAVSRMEGRIPATLTFCTVRAITISVAQLRPYQHPPRMQKAHLDLDGGGFLIFIPTGDC